MRWFRIRFGGTWQWSYTPQDNAPASVTITANDQNGATTATVFSLTVKNVSPAVTITGPAAGSVFPAGTPVTFTGTFTDPGALDTHTAQWTFDAITAPGTVVENTGNGSVSATY